MVESKNSLSGNKRHASDNLPQDETPRTPRKCISKAPHTPGTPRRTSKLKGINRGLISFDVDMSVVSSPGSNYPVTPQRANEVLPVLTGPRSLPAAPVSSQANLDRSNPADSLPGSQPLQSQGMTIRAFIDCPPGTPRRSSMPEKLCRVLECIKAEELTLPTFLLALFKSDEKIAKDYTSSFYEADGPQRLVEVWDQKLRHNKKYQRWDESFVNSAVDVVVDRTLKHLNDDDVKREWRLPYTEITEERIAQYLLHDFGFLRRYAAGTGDDENDGTAHGMSHAVGRSNTKGKKGGAKYLTRFLKGVLKEDEPPSQNLTGKASKRTSTRHPSSVRGCISAMLLFMSSRQANAFQTILGIFLHSTGCPRRVLEVLSGLGLSISSSQVHKCLESLTTEACKRVIKAVKENDFYVVYDNINIANKHHHQRSNNRDTFDNGTSATIILSGKEKPVPTLFREQTLNAVADEFLPNDADFEVFFKACQAHVSNSMASSPAAGPTMSAIPMIPVEQLNSVKSTVFPIKVMRLDESTIAGNLAVLKRIAEESLKLPEPWLVNPENTIFAGDQMTVSRLLTLKVHRSFDPSRYHNLSWVHPILQLFHLQMNLCGTIWRTHLGSQEFCGTLASIAVLLGRKRLLKDKPTFHDINELLRIVFDAKIQQLYQCLRERGVPPELAVQKISKTIVDCCYDQPSLPLLDLPSTAANTNALLFLRDVAVLVELGAAIKAGDIGRIKHVLPLITLMMHGGGNTNYAPELLRLLYGIRHLWTDEWATRVLSSMLVNPKGTVGGWMPTDMMQENHNYLLKSIFAAKGSNMTWEHLQESISTNIKTFQDISRMFEQEVGVRSNSTKHKKPSYSEDIGMLQENLKGGGILWPFGACPHGPPAVNLQAVGEEKMVGGSIRKFLDNQTSLMGDAVDIEEAEGLENVLNDDIEFTV